MIILLSSMAPTATTVVPDLTKIKSCSRPTITSKLSSHSLSRIGNHNNHRPWIQNSHVSQSVLEVAVQPSPPPRQQRNVEKKNGGDNDNYYVNLGTAIRTLRDELPVIFNQDLTYDIYRDDITFSEPLNTFHGIENYKLIFWALRFHGRILFKSIWIDVGRIWQPSERVILIRWTVRGIPRVPWEAEGRFEGTSKYKLDRTGKIYEHHVDNLNFNFPEKLRPASVLDLVRVAGCPTSPTPTFFNAFLPVSVIEETAWLQLYRSVKNTLDFNSVPIAYGCC